MRRRRLATTPLGVGRSATRVDHPPAPSKERTDPLHHARTHRSRRRQYRGHRGLVCSDNPRDLRRDSRLSLSPLLRKSTGRMPGTSFRLRLIAIGGAVLGMIIALALRARFAAYWWAVFSVFNTVGSVWYLRSGIVDLPRYGATQSAMLMAATCGVVLAAIMREPPGTETDDSAGAPASFLSRHRITAHLIAGTIGFAIVDFLIRMRDRLLVADNVNHYAVLGSAIFAAILAGLIGRHG